MRVSLMNSGKEFANFATKSEYFTALTTLKFFEYNGVDYEIVDRKIRLSNSTLQLWVKEI